MELQLLKSLHHIVYQTQLVLMLQLHLLALQMYLEQASMEATTELFTDADEAGFVLHQDEKEV